MKLVLTIDRILRVSATAIVDDHGVRASSKSSIAPAPGSKESADRHAEAESDRTANHET
jgi:hypothetical protein